MYMVRAVEPVGEKHKITSSPVTGADIDPEGPRLDPDGEVELTFADFAIATTGEPWIFTTSKPNRWVVGEVFYVDLKPTR